MDRERHWREVWGTKKPDEVSWFEVAPETSVDVVTAATSSPQDGVIDVGGGASRLVDRLVEGGFTDVTVLDIAPGGLEQARRRLGARAAEVDWVTADVTRWQPRRQWRVWHDRAVFHFLTEDEDVAAYAGTLEAALEPGATAIIATFGPDGPRKCSGLWVRRYGPQELVEALGPAFSLTESFIKSHTTPSGVAQEFHWGLVRRT